MTPHDPKATAGLEVEYSLEILAEGGGTLDLCRRYWQLDSTGDFVHTVTAIGRPYKLPPATVTAYAEQYSRAFFPDARCPSCEKPHRVRNREDYRVSKSLRHLPRVCRECQEAQRLEAQRAAEEQHRLRVAAVQAELDQQRRNFLPYNLLAFDDAVFLLSLFRAGGSEDLTFIVPHHAFGLSLSPTIAFDLRILNHLYGRRIIAICPGSSPDSIGAGEAGPFSTFFPFKVHWQLPLPQAGPSPARYLEDLEALVNAAPDWPDDWAAESRELHRAVAFEECLEYLRLSLEEHGFDSQPGEKLTLVLRSVLRHFSIGQTYNFIWRAARDAAAFYVRERTSKIHARNIVPGSLQRQAERALVEGWAVKPYRRDRRVPESQVSHVLFTLALKLPDGGFTAPVPPPPADQEPGESS